MKKFAFLAFLLLFYYIAGMYGSPALMVLFLTQLFLMAVMFLLSFYLRRHLSADFAEKLVSAEKDRPFAWKLRTDNNGKLPVSRFALRYRICGQEKEDVCKRKLYGNSACGENLLTYEDTAGHCGIFNFRARSLKVYDYLALFSRKRTIRAEMKVVVFPKKYEMKLETETAFIGSEEPYPQSSFLPESGSGEIRQLREYRDGDLARHIHWNQTARTGRLWVKEYEEEAKGEVRLFLDLKEQEEAVSSDWDAFYTLLYALLSGLLQKAASVRVYWRGKTGLSEIAIRDDAQCRKLLFWLYTDRIEDETGGEGKNIEGAMRLTRDLSWYAGERLLFRFSKEKLMEELTYRTFRIRIGENT